MMIRFSAFLVLLMMFSVGLYGQHDHSGHNHGHGQGDDPHKYHIGLGVAGTRIISEDAFAPALHVHFLRQLGQHNQWGIGLGYEAIADEHWHNGINLLGNYRPAKFLSILAGPGLVIGEHDGSTEIGPAFHTEAVFEFNLGGLHVGPMIGFGYDREDRHISAGIHVGIGL